MNAHAQPDAVTDLAPPEGRYVTTADGTLLAASWTRPLGPPRGAVLIVPAMGVPQRYYEAFAAWLGREGFHALTFDYRGMGASRRGSLRGFDADIVTWGEQDTAAALDELTRVAPGLPVTWIGHSLGGQIVPFTPNHGRAARIVTVAAGSGYWKRNSPALRRRVWLLWFGVAPVATRLAGYFPGRRLGMVGDLPRGVLEQWRSWCLDERYAVGVGGEPVQALFDAVTTPIASISFDDDEMMSEWSIRSLHGFYRSADVALHRFSPADLGRERVGHFGFFRRELEPFWRARVLGELAAR